MEIDYDTGVHQLIIFSSSITHLEEGDEIAVFDLNGFQNSGDCSSGIGKVLVGAGTWQGEQLAISAIGSVDNCSFGGSQLAGYVDGNSIVVRIWDDSEDKEYETTFTITEGSDTFSTPGPTVITELNILGCIDDSACNYSSAANEDDDSCEYPSDLDWCDCNEHILDECGVCGGSGIPDGECDCAGNILDACDVCGGEGVDSDADGICDDVDECIGEYDECNVCNGLGAIYQCGCSDIPDGYCDCNEHILDECGVCGGSGHSDNCGVCDDIPDNDCVADCAGTWGGIAVEDECNLCGGDNSTCIDCNNTSNGDAYIDGCGECVGGTTGKEECAFDCAGVFNGTSFFDNCDVCVPDGNTFCQQGCDGLWYNSGSIPEFDLCGVCTGDNSSCSGCMDEFALNYDLGASIPDLSCEYPVYGCMDSGALNYNADATHSDTSCEYPPIIGLSIGTIDQSGSTIEILLNSSVEISSFQFSISGITLAAASGGSAEAGGMSVSVSGNAISSDPGGSIAVGSGILTILTFTDSSELFCISDFAIDIDLADLKIGGCATVITPEAGGEVVNEDGGVDIPAGALSMSETISIGEVTEKLPESVNNATGFEIEKITAFTPYDLVFDIPVEIMVSSGTLGRSQGSGDEYVCVLENSEDTSWEVVNGANCNNGSCTADITYFGIFAVCNLIEDCNGDLGGSAYYDGCSDCVGGNTNLLADYGLDDCGLCSGPGKRNWYHDNDNDGWGSGDGVEYCADDVPSGYVANSGDPEPDCSTNDTDECGICGGSGMPDGACDCDENVLDNCSICGGDNSTCDLSITTALVPVGYDLFHNYPNPFNPVTTISFSLPRIGAVSIIIYDLTGREVITLINKPMNTGFYSLYWNASSYPSGVYLIRMVSGDFTQTQKVVLVK